MKDDNYYLNILNYGAPNGTISISPHPEELIEVDFRIIQQLKERLSKNKEKDHVIFDELELKREKQKLKSIIESKEILLDYFSSVENIISFEQEINKQKINKKLLYDYSYYLSNYKTVDAFDFYCYFIFDDKLRTKDERVKFHQKNKNLNLLDEVLGYYRLKHFDFLKVTKEIISVNLDIRHLFKTRALLPQLDKYLNHFYLNN